MGGILAKVTANFMTSSDIMDCSEELLVTYHDLFGMIASIDMQNLNNVESVCKKADHLFNTEFGIYGCKISPSLHRALQHTKLYMDFYQKQGFSLGATSEGAIEAKNYDNKEDLVRHSHRGDVASSNLNIFHKSWWAADPCIGGSK